MAKKTKPAKPRSRRWETIDREPQGNPTGPLSVWARGTEPMPSDDHQLVAEIKAFAAARQRDALSHPLGHDCDGCKVRRTDQQTRRLAS